MLAKRAVVLDKSYVQGERSLLRLGAECELLFPDALFFEVVATNETARGRCLRKLEEAGREGRIRVVPNVGELLEKEIEGLSPAGRPSDNVMADLDVGELYRMDFDNLSAKRREALRGRQSDFGDDLKSLISRSKPMLGVFPETSSGTTESRAAAFDDAARAIADDGALVLEFFARFVCGGAHRPTNSAGLAEIARGGGMGSEWTIFRWVQVQLLYGLEWMRRYGPLDPEAVPPRQLKRLTNDVIDMEYVTLGVLQGAIATTDKGIASMFGLLRGDGAVYGRSSPGPEPGG